MKQDSAYVYWNPVDICLKVEDSKRPRFVCFVLGGRGFQGGYECHDWRNRGQKKSIPP